MRWIVQVVLRIMLAYLQAVVIFRFELSDALNSFRTTATMPPDGKIFVIFLLNFKGPATFYLVQRFTVQNKVVLYVSNASAAELQEFFNTAVTVCAAYEYW